MKLGYAAIRNQRNIPITAFNQGASTSSRAKTTQLDSVIVSYG